MAFLRLLDRFWTHFGTRFGTKLGASWLQNRKNKGTRKMTKNNAIESLAGSRGETQVILGLAP